MIKLIATDMDGTWLNDKKSYDVDLFLREFKIMQERNIKFVVASGNQHQNLLTRFPKVAEKKSTLLLKMVRWSLREDRCCIMMRYLIMIGQLC